MHTYPHAPVTLQASYYDGISARPQAVTLSIDAAGLRIAGDSFVHYVPLHEVQWPERTRHGMRKAHFAHGGVVQCADSTAWDHWYAASGQRESLLIKLQQSWRGVAICLFVLIALLVGLQQWGLPVISRAVVAVTPLSVDAALGQSSLKAIDEQLMEPSQLPAAEQTRLREAFTRTLTHSSAQIPDWQLVFRHSPVVGANAFALPGGTMVMTDELVELVDGDEQVITAVLAHELTHVSHRHGLRMLVQVTALSAIASMVLGDFSSVLASAPVILGQASYSRDAEREADAGAVEILRAAGISPQVMVVLFEKLAAQHAEKNDPRDSLGIAFSSHPADAERIAFFEHAATQ